MTKLPITIKKIELIGNEIAFLWSDGREDYFTPHFLRLNSPSAENIGEKDLVGRTFLQGSSQKIPDEIQITGWQPVGGYAIRFSFSDGHRTGIYSFDYLRKLAESQA